MANRWSEADTIRAGAQIVELAEQHRAAMERRLSAGLIEATRSRVEELRLLTGAKTTARNEQQGATVTQNVAIERGSELVSRLRRLVRTGAPTDKALWRTFGVGKDPTRSVKSVASALIALIDGVVKNQNKALAVGILPEDLDQARLYTASLEDADNVQEGKKVSAKASTARVRELLDQLKRDLSHLASVAHASVPANVAARFDAALPSTSTRKAPASQPS
jgi:hypothetical protein